MQIKIVNIRLIKEHFEEDQELLNNFLDTVQFKKSAVKLIEAKINFWSVCIHYEEITELKEPKQLDDSSEKINEADLSAEEHEVFLALKKWRQDEAAEESIPVFMICSNETLCQIARNKPINGDELINIKGMGQVKVSKYGSDIIALLNSV